MEGMSFERGSWYEGPTTLDELERARTMQEIAEAVQESSSERAATEINKDPLLQGILGKIIESGPELSPDMVRHLRMIVALRIGHLVDAGLRAGEDAEFWGIVETEVGEELDTLISMEGLEDLPDPSWDFALQDLLRLEGED